MIGELISQKEIDKMIEDLKREGYTKEQAIELQEDVCRTTFNDSKFADEQYKRILFSKAPYKEKKEKLFCLNRALKEHLKQIQILDTLKESNLWKV